MSETLFGESLTKHVVGRVAQSGSDLGTGVRTTHAGAVEGYLDGPALGGREWRPKVSDALARDVAVGKAAEIDNPNSFRAKFIRAGFMLAEPDGKNVAGHDRQIAAMKAAPTDELQDVLRATVGRRGGLEAKEVGLRVAEIIRLNPAGFEEWVAKDPSKDREKGLATFTEKVAKADFAQQRAWATDKSTGIFPSLDSDDRRSLKALSRGFVAISGELRERGVEVGYMMKGREIGPKSRPAPVAGGPAGGGRPTMRDGIEI